MQVDLSPAFQKQLKKVPNEIKVAVRNRLDLFASNPQHPLLRNHLLKGLYMDCRSINITGDWRAMYEETDAGSVAHFIALGTHSQLYK